MPALSSRLSLALAGTILLLWGGLAPIAAQEKPQAAEKISVPAA